MPKSHMVRNGTQPRHVDDDVRFRTTYYIRVVDVCGASENSKLPEVQAMYRFRMTGKANSLFNEIEFESGTVHTSDIEPFGVKLDSFKGKKTLPGPTVRTCGDASQVAGRLQILGPEGWRDFDPEERLIIAMSSSGAPLVQELKQVAALKSAPGNNLPALNGLLSRELMRVQLAEDYLKKLKIPDDSQPLDKTKLEDFKKQVKDITQAISGKADE